MSALRRFLSDLALIPHIWRKLVAGARADMAWERKTAEFTLPPEYRERQARIAARKAEAAGAKPEGVTLQ